MRNEPLVISLLLFAALFLVDEYGWLASLAIASALTMFAVSSPIIRLGNIFWTLSRGFTVLSNVGSNAFIQRVTLREEGITTLWAMTGPILFVPSLLILKYAVTGFSADYVVQTAFTTSLLSISLIGVTSATPEGASLNLIRVTTISALISFISAGVMGYPYSQGLVSVSLCSSYLSVLLATDIRNIPYLASNGVTSVVLGGRGVRDALVVVPVATSSIVWLILRIIPS